jgi:DNA polymerase
MAQALAHGLPGALGTLGTIFGLADDEQKSKAGKALVQRFCKPRPKHVKLRRATRETHPEEWAEFVAYAGLDVVAMRQLYRKLPRWNYEGAELELWRLDQRINARGFAVDRDLARAALRATDAAKAKLDARTAEITDSGVRSAMQRDALLRYVLEEHGVELPDLQASTLERRVDDETLPAPVRELLAIRLQSSGTSIRKYQRLLGATSSDGRLRGTLLWNGASRTGRWSGRVFQPQNLPRTPEWFNAEEQERAVEAMKLGVEDLLYA